MGETTLFQTDTDLDAKDVLSALREKHSDDIFVPEVKAGSSWAGRGGVPRMDAWVMKPSWTKPEITAYEIKVSRSDFLSDEKWPEYLPYCNRFWFVCPWKLLLPQEMPTNAGLMWVQSTGNRVIRKKKPEYREVNAEDLELVFRYLLMWRTRVTRERRRGEDGAEYWRRWLEQKEENQRLGHQVSIRIHEIVREARESAKIAEKKVEGYEHIRERMDELGLDPEVPVSTWAGKRKVDEALRGEILQTRDHVEAARREAKHAQGKLDRCLSRLNAVVSGSEEDNDVF